MPSQPWRLFGLLVALSLPTVVGSTQTYTRYLLSQAEYRALPAQAQTHYEQAIDHLNHIDYEYAHDSMHRAAEAAPDHIAIQFKLYDLANRQARQATSRRAEDYRLVGLQALQRVVDNEAATPQERVRAEREIASIRTQMEQAQSQELARRTAGRNYIYAFALENTWYSSSQQTDDTRTPAILTQPGPGSALTRSEVVLVDQSGMIYHADGLPYIDSNGVQMNQNSLVGVTLTQQPAEGFFRGTAAPDEDEGEFSLDAQLSDFLGDDDQVSMGFDDDDDMGGDDDDMGEGDDDAGETEMAEDSGQDDAPVRASGSLSPATFGAAESADEDSPFAF